MSVTTTQPQPNFQQLSLLRKILAQKSTGALSYESQSGHRGEITISMGSIVNGEQASKEFPIFFSEAVQRCDWQKKLFGNSHDSINPTVSISRAINDIQWNYETIMSLKQLFFKLPPVRIRMIPLHRYEYNDGLTYLMLYQQSVKTDHFLLKDFLNDAADSEMLKRRVKVLVLGYCLGLISAVSPQANNDKNTNAGIAARILRRIRGM